MLSKKEKDKIIGKYRSHQNDTGSPAVQIAILSTEIEQLADHLKKHKKDFSSRRGLLKKVGQRRKLARYLKKEDPKNFEDIAKKLKIKA